MRTFKYIALGAIAALGLVSCNLNFPPTSFVATDTYFESARDINSGLMGCYNGLHAVMKNEWQVTEMRSDNTKSSTSTSSGAATVTSTRAQLDMSQIVTSNPSIEGYWNASWAAISRTNLVLANIEAANDEPALRPQYEAEALFLRAHLYFNLVRLWGPMFKVETPLSAEDAFVMQRSSEDEIYGMIERDLERIIYNEMLPEVYPSKDLGRATMDAARFMLAKVYTVHYTTGSEEYEVAIDLLRDVVGDITSLPVAYEDIFDVDNEMSEEIIFAVRYKAGQLGLGSPFATYFSPQNSDDSVVIGDGDGLNSITNDTIAAFAADPNEKRGVGVSFEIGYVDANGVWGEEGGDRYIKKFWSEIQFADDGENDWPIMRMGDATLYLAELINENYGPTQEAIDYLNMTRTRGGLTPLTSADLPSKYYFRNAIKTERRLELAFENHRWFDLIRWGADYAAEVMSNHFTNEEFYAEYDPSVLQIKEWQILMPIPFSVMSTNPYCAQNIGY